MEHEETFICIENMWFEKYLTIGKRYKGQSINGKFYIIYDVFGSGSKTTFSKKMFTTLKEYRKNKISNLIRNIL